MDSSKYLNNSVEIQSDKKIDEHDVELIQLYFESAKASGGSDTVSNLFDSTTQTFHIDYKFNETKLGLVGQKRRFKDYTLAISDTVPMSIRTFKASHNRLIIKNIDHNEDLTVVELYADYLVNGDNEIESIERSTIIQNVFVIKFKQDFDFKNALKRLAKRPRLREKPIEIYHAYETNVLLVDLKECDGDYEDQLDSLFNESSRSSWQLVFKSTRNTFAFVKYENPSLFERQLKFNFEKCFNFALVDSFIQERIEVLQKSGMVQKPNIANEQGNLLQPS
jgi:hypothetical protein